MEQLFKRDIVDSIEKWMDKPEIIVLLGARQVGKTSIMKILYQKLAPNKYLYFDLEDTFTLQIFNSTRSFTDYIDSKGFNRQEKLYVFIDEIQYLPEPAKFLKLIHDHHPLIKLVVSGSSSFEIRRKFSDGLTGRKIVFTVYPLNFKEYLAFKKNSIESVKKEISFGETVMDFNRIRKYGSLTSEALPVFEEFMIFGGYPLPALTVEIEQKILRLKEIHNTYIHKDIKDLARIENLLQFNRLTAYLAVQIGNMLNLNEACKELGIQRRQAEDFIFILEKTFVLGILKPFFTNRQKEITKMPKVFFCDTGMRNMSINDMRPPEARQDKGAIAENVFFQEMLKNKNVLQEIQYWRTKEQHEVDFILTEGREPVPVEIKYQKFTGPEIAGSMRYFIEKFSPARAVIVTRDYTGMIKTGNTEVFFMPLWMV